MTKAPVLLNLTRFGAVLTTLKRGKTLPTIHRYLLWRDQQLSSTRESITFSTLPTTS